MLPALLALAVAAGGAAPAASGDWDRLLRRAGRHLFNVEFDQAKALFDQAETLRPDDPSIAYYRAVSCWWRELVRDPDGDGAACLGDIAAAVAAAKRWIELDRDDALGHYFLGRSYAMRARVNGFRRKYRKTIGDMRRAHRHLTRAEKLDPAYRRMSVDMGLYKYMATRLPAIAKVVRVLLFLPGGDREEGLARLRQVAADGGILGDEAQVYLAAIETRYERQPGRSVERLDHLTRRYPKNPFSWLHLARITRRNLGQPREALRVYRHIYELAEVDTPAERWARMGEGMSWLALGDLERARPLLASVQDDLDSTGDEALRGLVRLEILRDDPAAAWRFYRKLEKRKRPIAKRYARRALNDLTKPPGRKELRFLRHWHRALRADAQGDRPGRALQWRLALAVSPNDPRVLYAMAEQARAEDRPEAARQLFQTVAGSGRSGVELRAYALYELGRLDERAGDRETALARYAMVTAYPGLLRLKDDVACHLTELSQARATVPPVVRISTAE